MFDCSAVTLTLQQKKKEEREKFRLEHRKSKRTTHSTSGIKEAKKNAGIRAKKCEIFEECCPRHGVRMIERESRVKY